VPTLFDRLGGETAIEAAVVRFYDKVLEDASLAPFFEGMDMGKIIQKQIAFMTMAFGGPTKYTGKDLRTAHARLVTAGLGDAHFDAVAGHLVSTLKELGIDGGMIDEVVAIVGPTRKDVLGQ
jgi:hemoglobin